MKRVKADFSTTVRGGLVRASLRHSPDGLQRGDRVTAFDPGEDMEFVGVVDDLDERFAYLRMEWHGGEDAGRDEPGMDLSVGRSKR